MKIKNIKLLIIFSVTLLFGCSNEDIKVNDVLNELNKELIKDSTNVIVDSTNIEELKCNVATDSVLDVITMDEAGIEFPKEILQKGKLIDGASWTDAIGLNYIQVYSIENGEFFEENYNSELHVYHHVKCMQKDDFTEYWHIKDFGGEVYKSVNYWPHTLKISDIDNDGAAETEFFYAIQPDGLDMSDLKLMFHTRGIKMPIRGGFYYGEDGIEIAFKNPDSLLIEFPEFLSYANSKWDQWIEIESNRE